MKKWPAYIASALTFMGALGHMIGGGKTVADPLLGNPTLTNHDSAMLWMIWHVVSATFMAMAFLYGYGAYRNRPDFIRSSLLLTVMIGLVGLIAPWYLGVGYKVLPNGLAFIPIGILGFMSIYKLKRKS